MIMNSVLVTGGAGYIGSHACKYLAAQGYLPVTVDNLSTGFSSVVKWGPLEIADIRQTSILSDIIRRYRPVAVVHFAALSSVGESVNIPYDYYENNVCGTLSLLSAMRSNGVNNLVFSSTCAVYGVPETVPIKESNVRNPINPYGRTKLAIEFILEDLAVTAELNYVILRYFNAAGADPAGEIGELHDPETHLIPLAIRAAMTGQALSVFGDDFLTPDGTAVRDYIHVIDLAAAHYLAIDYLRRGGPPIALNLGTGIGYSVRQIVEALGSIGMLVPTKGAPRRKGDPPILVADSSNARRVLGWKPEFSSLQDILKSATHWHKEGMLVGASKSDPAS